MTRRGRARYYVIAMAVQTLTLAGKRFVILPESEYRKLRAAPKRNGKSAPARAAKRPRKRRRLTAHDRGDIAEVNRRANEPTIPWSEARKQLGLE